MKLTVKEIIIITDTIRGSLKVLDDYNRKFFNYSEEERKKLLMHLDSLADSTCITLEGSSGSKK